MFIVFLSADRKDVYSVPKIEYICIYAISLTLNHTQHVCLNHQLFSVNKVACRFAVKGYSYCVARLFLAVQNTDCLRTDSNTCFLVSVIVYKIIIKKEKSPFVVWVFL